jgi:hypothetical protein
VAFFGDDRPRAFAPITVTDDGSLPAVDHGETERDASRDVRTRPVYRLYGFNVRLNDRIPYEEIAPVMRQRFAPKK